MIVASAIALAASINGTSHADRLVGSPRSDTIKGFGDDRIDGKGGHDTLRGYAGHDTTDGEDGNAPLVGGPGNDRTISGTDDRHLLFARYGEQDLIRISPNSSGRIETADPIDIFIFDRSCPFSVHGARSERSAQQALTKIV